MFAPKQNTLSPDSDLLTPIGQLIKAATDPVLLGPDWSQNLDICDQTNNFRDGAEQALRAIGVTLIIYYYYIVILFIIFIYILLYFILLYKVLNKFII